jgi:hypothetical protein
VRLQKRLRAAVLALCETRLTARFGQIGLRLGEVGAITALVDDEQ